MATESFEDFNVGDAVVYCYGYVGEITRATVTAKTNTYLTVSTGKKFSRRLKEWGTARDSGYVSVYLYKWSAAWAEKVKAAQERHHDALIRSRIAQYAWNQVPVADVEEIIALLERRAAEREGKE